jgi:hypothetical protein
MAADLLSPGSNQENIRSGWGLRCRDLAVAQTLAAAASILHLGIPFYNVCLLHFS